MATINGKAKDYNALSTAIDERKNYKTQGGLSGEYVAETRGNVAHYVIRSYDEVIGFMTYYDKWSIIVTRKFSVTTSKHTSVAFMALTYSSKRVQTLDNNYRLSADGVEYV